MVASGKVLKQKPQNVMRILSGVVKVTESMQFWLSSREICPLNSWVLLTACSVRVARIISPVRVTPVSTLVSSSGRTLASTLWLSRGGGFHAW